MRFYPSYLKEEHGSALATVLAISVIVLLFIGAILSGVVVQLRFIQRDINQTKALYEAEAQVYRFLGDTTTSINALPPQLADSTGSSLQAVPYGGFWKIESTAKVGSRSATVQTLIGERADSLFNHAVVLGDSTSGITLTGNSILTGDILTSEKGISTVSYKGMPFRGTFDGNQRYFEDELQFPSFNTQNIEHQIEWIRSIFENQNPGSYQSGFDGFNQSERIQANDTLFYDDSVEWDTFDQVELPEALTIIVHGNMTIDGAYRFGKFTQFMVRDTLRINGEIQGRHLRLYGGAGIELGGTSSFSGQLISGDNIDLKEQVYLQYPSLLVSMKEFYQGGSQEVIAIRNSAKVDGTILYPISTNDANSDLLRVLISESAVVRGSIYTLGQTELHGNVLGSVLSHQFYFYDSPTQYLNWLKDVRIDVTQRPEQFVVPIGFSESPEYALLDWFVEVDG